LTKRRALAVLDVWGQLVNHTGNLHISVRLHMERKKNCIRDAWIGRRKVDSREIFSNNFGANEIVPLMFQV